MYIRTLFARMFGRTAFTSGYRPKSIVRMAGGLVACALALSGCATAPHHDKVAQNRPVIEKNSAPLGREDSERIETVSIVVDWPQAASDIHGVSVSRGKGAGKGAADFSGGLLAADCSGSDPAGELLVCGGTKVLLLPFAAILGAIVGGATTPSKKSTIRWQEELSVGLKDVADPASLDDALRLSIAAQTPYEIDAPSDSDAVLTVHVPALEISGDGLEGQAVRLNLLLDAELQLTADGADSPAFFAKRYRLQYGGKRGVHKLKKLAKEIDAIRDWIPAATVALSSRVADDIWDGFASTRWQFKQAEPITRRVCNYRTCKPRKVKTLRPTLTWSEFDPGSASDPSEIPIRYTVRIFELPRNPDGSQVELNPVARARVMTLQDPVYQVDDIPGSSYQIGEPLEPCKAYYWQVRAERSSTLGEQFSEWKGEVNRKNEFGAWGLSETTQLPWFETPCK